MTVEMMTEERKQKLIDIEPEWFKNCFDFDIPDKWYSLVESILLEAKKLGFSSNELSVGQIKSKFDGLRFYVDIADSPIQRNERRDKLYNFIGKKEVESYKICLYCGSIRNLPEKELIKEECKCEKIK